ncbi:MAG: alpha/beta hydrolase [Lentisphaeria bacterium]|nr:alpha/beta hydrolase [Lentisphaeria bacterium]
MLKSLFFSFIFSFCCVSAANPVIYRVGIRTNLEFLEKGRPERLDLYYPADPRPGDKFPGIVIIHGGSWCGGIRNADREINIGSNLARMGYVCISIDYRLATAANLKKYGRTFPTVIHDCKKAVQWLRKNADKLNVDASKIGALGCSAGGHLAALLGVAGPDAGLEPESSGKKIDTSIQACVNFYGVTDFAGFKSKSAASKYQCNVMGSLPTEKPEEWKRMSPVEQVNAKDAPMLQIYASNDKLVHYRQAEIMKKELDRHGVYNEYILLDGFGHQFNLQRWFKMKLPKFVRQRVFAFYDRFLKNMSAKESARRFAALENYEKNHPEASHYGILSLFSGKIEKTEQGIALDFRGRKKFFEPSFDMHLEKLVPASTAVLREGVKVRVYGSKRADGSLECTEIHSPVPYSRGIEKYYGILRKKDNSWLLENVKSKKVTNLIITDKTKIYFCKPIKLSELKSGSRIAVMHSRDYGDIGKIVYGLFTE